MNINSASRRVTAAGFSLVELLTVIAIITLLIGILVPAVNKVRMSAKNAATQALINTLSTGLETFRADQVVGGAYPPSAPDYKRAGLLQYTAVIPRPGNPAATAPTNLSGAGLLVWALAGADLLGTPGFKTFRETTNFWSLDTDNVYGGSASNSGAYALDDRGQPVHARSGPYVDLAKVDVTPWDHESSSYVIEVERKAAKAVGIEAPQRRYPFFLDAFGQPVLYWRADPAGQTIADPTPNNLSAQDRGVYHFMDNALLLATNADQMGGSGPPGGIHEDPLLLRAEKYNKEDMHKLVWQGSIPFNLNNRPQGFAHYIQNHDMAARVWPHNPESFLLVSAGADGIFGTADDIANFAHNGAEDLSHQHE